MKFLILFFSLNAFAIDFSVQTLKGQALLKKVKVYKLKKGISYTGPGIVATGKRSFVKLLLSDGGVVTLGPRSKVVIQKEKRGEPSVISLLEGKIRGAFSKGEDERHKVFIKTPSASVGVRGTEFLVSYNSKNHITSTTAFSGKVEFHKELDGHILEHIKESFDHKGLEHHLHKANLTDMKDRFESDQIVKITKGRFSGAYPTYDTPLPPTKISPHQVKALYSNPHFSEHKGETIYGKGHGRRKFSLSNKNLIPTPQTQEQELENLSHQEKILIADTSIRPGGVLDLETGMYVMPPKGSHFNKQTGVYELPSDYGGVDSKTGHYSPPQDVQVDHHLGFVKVVDGVKKQVDQFSDSVTKLFSKYKKITRVDLDAKANYFYSYKSFENYYGEYRNVTPAESMIFNFDGFIGRHLFNNPRYLHYIKAELSTTLHNRRDEPKVQRNDRLVSNFGYEFHRKHRFLDRKASLVFDINFETTYQDYRNKDKFDFYTEKSSLYVSQRLHFSKNYKFSIGAGLAAFQGHEDQNHGNIISAHLKNKYSFSSQLEGAILLDYSERHDKISSSHYRIFGQELMARYRNILRKTDVSLNTGLEQHQARSNHAFVKKLRLALERRKGEHFVFSAFYDYLQNDSDSKNENRDFVNQLWGVGAKFVF